MSSRPVKSRWLDSTSKRLFDIVIAGSCLVVFSPVLIVCSAMVGATSRGGAIFRQRRAGLDGREFAVLKLRTMVDSPGGREGTVPDAERLTGVGRILRRLSLDELPQLWNVVRGEMSLVGPRPLPVRYVDRYSEHQRRRLEARPGITGWAQVRGRNSIAWDAKFDLDVEYVESASLSMDLRILALTVRAVFVGAGVSAEGHATMPEFTGED